MSNRAFNSIVSNSEQQALKDMIFKRARERAQSLTEETQEACANAVQNDVMNLARNSFVAEKNPFSQIVKENKKDVETKEDVKTEKREIGFAQRQTKEIINQLESKNRFVNNNIVNSEISDSMNVAREEFYKKTSFTGALDFLNSQATISLIKNKGKNFEVLA